MPSDNSIQRFPDSDPKNLNYDLPERGQEIAIQPIGQQVIDITNTPEAERIKVNLSTEKIGLYLIRLSGHILSNLDEIWDSNPHLEMGPPPKEPIPERLAGFYKDKDPLLEVKIPQAGYKSDLSFDCILMAKVGAYLAEYGKSIDECFPHLENFRAVLEAEMHERSLILKRFDWDKLGWFVAKLEQCENIGFVSSETELKAILSDFLETVIEEHSFGGYTPDNCKTYDFLPPDISLLVNPIK